MNLISIIIATYNRSENLKEMLNSLLAQESDGTFTSEVIVVDNNSTDATKKTVEEYMPAFKGHLKYFFEPTRGKMYAVNTGVQKAQGDILVFTDDDAIADPRWLINIVQCFERYHCDCVGGRILPRYSAGTPNWVKDNVKTLAGPIVIYDYGEDVKEYKKPQLEFFGANLALKKEVFTQCGLFRTDIGPGRATMGDDTEYVNRVLRRGKKIFYCGKALVWHPAELERMNLKYIAQWNMALGRYRVLVDEQGIIDTALKYYGGIPRYLIREIVQEALWLIPSIFNKPQFLRTWTHLFINIGKAAQIRTIYQQRSVQA